MWTLFLLLAFASAANSFRLLGSSTLGKDPQTVNRLNGESFQQDALVTFNGMFPCKDAFALNSDSHCGLLGYQYAVFWTNDAVNTSIRHPSISRRSLKESREAQFQTFTLLDYNQTDDDGHDMYVFTPKSFQLVLQTAYSQHIPWNLWRRWNTAHWFRPTR